MIDARGTPRTVDWVVVDVEGVHHQVLLIAIHGTHAVGCLLQLNVKAVHGRSAFDAAVEASTQRGRARHSRQEQCSQELSSSVASGQN